eukprot:349832-Chlamydomonas_euryale.AAC.2
MPPHRQHPAAQVSAAAPLPHTPAPAPNVHYAHTPSCTTHLRVELRQAGRGDPLEGQQPCLLRAQPQRGHRVCQVGEALRTGRTHTYTHTCMRLRNSDQFAPGLKAFDSLASSSFSSSGLAAPAFIAWPSFFFLSDGSVRIPSFLLASASQAFGI